MEKIRKEDMTDARIISYLRHFMIDDGFGWETAGILRQNLGMDITDKEVKKIAQRYFKELTGYKVYTKCPLCEGEIVPRDGPYGYFVSCSEFPDCDFKAGKKRKNTK